MNDEEKYSTIGNRRITKKKRCYELSSKKNFVLGCENNEAKDCNNSLLKTFKLPYVSPINCFIDTRDFNNKIPVNREAESDKYMTEAIKEDIKVEDTQCVNLEEKLNKSTTNDTISEQFSSIIPNNTQNSVNTLDSSNLVTSSPSIILPDSSVTMHFEKNISSFNTVMASESENIKEVKIEKTINTEHLKVLESSVPDNSTPSKNDTTLLNNSNELSMCINSLRITLMLMIKEKISSTGEIVRSLKLLINELITDTNGNVNPQIPMEEVDGGSGNEQQTFMCRQETSSSLSQVEQQTSQTSNYALSLSPQSLAVDSKCEQKNVDVLALNLRMDSFEKRYDTCLKELGGIISEMSNIKSEIKEIKETLATLQGISLPRQKGGMLQTALNMGGNSSRVENSFSDGNKTFPQLQSSLSSR